MLISLYRTAVWFAAPATLLLAGFALVYHGDVLPQSLAGLKVYGPYITFGVGAVLAMAFNRGRALLALIVLAGAYGAQQAWLQQGLEVPVARAVYAGLALFVPIDLALLAVLPERGVYSRQIGLRLAVIALQAALIAWLATGGEPAVTDWAYQKVVDPSPFTIGRIPQLGIILIGLGLLIAIVATLVTRSATPATMTGAIVAFAIAAHVPAASVSFSIFISMAQLMVIIAIVQDTYHMAFRDDLTGLPGRRALNERLTALGNHYAIAMLDVDHFKKFNDTHGHDLGDQVLKMVAAHIAGVGGGGKAYRYGGEEFTVVFPGREASEALPYLEALRAEVESYRLALRGSDRPKKEKNGSKRQRGSWRDKDSVSVTISIGVAERNDRLTTPQAVIEAADRALYRAKEKGRNRVSR